MKALFSHWLGPFLCLGSRPLTLLWAKPRWSSCADISHSFPRSLIQHFRRLTCNSLRVPSPGLGGGGPGSWPRPHSTPVPRAAGHMGSHSGADCGAAQPGAGSPGQGHRRVIPALSIQANKVAGAGGWQAEGRVGKGTPGKGSSMCKGPGSESEPGESWSCESGLAVRHGRHLGDAGREPQGPAGSVPLIIKCAPSSQASRGPTTHRSLGLRPCVGVVLRIGSQTRCLRQEVGSLQQAYGLRPWDPEVQPSSPAELLDPGPCHSRELLPGPKPIFLGRS